jgi:prepilin-type N-terminal cleavage/methylation domain-containing protein
MNISRGKRAFSLVELLVVMAIMAVLGSLVTMSFSGLMGGNRLVAGGNDLMNLANQARQEAISKNTMTALVLISSSGQPQWDRRVFRVIELTPADTAANTAAAWAPASAWHSLPDGISPDTQNDTLAAFSANLNLPASLPAQNFKGTSISASQLEEIVFLPDGRLLSTASTTGNSFVTPPVLRLFNKAVASAAPATGNYYQITFNSLTGEPIVDRP